MRTIEESIVELEAWRVGGKGRDYEIISQLDEFPPWARFRDGGDSMTRIDGKTIREALHNLCEELKK